MYFQLVNQAEDVHGVRESRRRAAEGGIEADSMSAVLQQVAATHSFEQARAALAEVHVGFVFTAHPTEARRRTTERLLADVRAALISLDRESLTPTERRQAMRQLNARVESLWMHASERSSKPTVLDEVKTGVWYLRQVLLDVAPRIQRRLADAFEAAFGEPVDPTSLPTPAYFGSWMGGDRDGNPFVSDAILERTLEIQRFVCIDRYTNDVKALADPLAAHAQTLTATQALQDALARSESALPEIVAHAESRNPDEPLRRLLTYIIERLERTGRLAAGGYPHRADLLDDLDAIRETLIRSGAQALAHDALVDLIVRVRVFGFHLAALDVREDSAVHRTVVAELLGDPEYPTRPAAERIAALRRLSRPQRGASLSTAAKRCLSLFETLARCQARFGRSAVQTYIISMTESGADVLEVLRLLELHGIADSVDVVPLFETRAALESTSEILQDLFQDTGYRHHLHHRSNVQELVVGYSDSMKQNGTLASRILVLDTQRNASDVCRAHGVRLRVFHGRGGSTSRGGGPTYRAIRALPPDAFSGDLKLTEQGEVRSFHFSSPDVAERYLEQTVGAALLTRLDARTGGGEVGPRTKLWDSLADLSAKAYRELVDAEDLFEFYEKATPFSVIAQLNIASRPSKRRAGELSLSSLRAIPWVFAWSQQRSVVTGWYGVGTALANTDSEQLRHLFESSAFFRDVLDNVEMTLAKTDLAITRRYAELCVDDSIRDRILRRIEAEHRRTVSGVLDVIGHSQVLGRDETTRNSIELRNPYVDPLSYVQIVALQRLRAGEEGWSRVARATVQGIAAGLRNTG